MGRVLLQASVGLFMAEFGLRLFTPTFANIHPPVVLLGLLAALLGFAAIGGGAAGLRAATRTPWSVREALAFILFTAESSAHALLVYLDRLMQGRLPSSLVDPVFHTISALWGADAMIGTINSLGQASYLYSGLTSFTAPCAVLAGVLVVMATVGAGHAGKPVSSALRIGGGVLLLGVAGAAACLVLEEATVRLVRAALAFLVALAVAKLGAEAAFFVRPSLAAAGAEGEEEASGIAPAPRVKTGRLLLGRLSTLLRLRFAAGAAGGVVLPFLLWIGAPSLASGTETALAFAAFALLLLGEGCERRLFAETA